jgi:hypothetical protein
MSDIWQQIVAESLKEGVQISHGAVPGAKLRQLIARTAEKRGEKYPPADRQHQKFGDFLSAFGSLLITLRRNGQDILVAPVDNPELLNSAQNGQAHLREDIFEAFTHIPRGTPPVEPWYERDTDKVRWVPATESLDPEKFAKIAPATLNQELEDRKAFAQSSEIDSQIAEALVATLQDHSGLWAFSKSLKEHGLSRKWHLYRFQALVRRIRAWCNAQDVGWREDWLTSTADPPTRPQLGKASISRAEQGRLFERFVATLDDEDLKRVSVPLDIVLKLLQR